MKYAQLRKNDVANGEGIRVSLFTSGCTHNCKGCFNKDYQSFDYGDDMTNDVVDEIIEQLRNDYNSGLTILGGEPFQSLDLVAYLKPIRDYIDEYNKKNSRNKKNIWVYSGYTFEQILADKKKLELLSLTDVLVDGLFEEKLLDLRLKFRGSSNQRILDVKKSIRSKKAINYY